MTLNFMQYEDVLSQTFIELLMHLRFIQELVKIHCLIIGLLFEKNMLIQFVTERKHTKYQNFKMVKFYRKKNR